MNRKWKWQEQPHCVVAWQWNLGLKAILLGDTSQYNMLAYLLQNFSTAQWIIFDNWVVAILWAFLDTMLVFQKIVCLKCLSCSYCFLWMHAAVLCGWNGSQEYGTWAIRSMSGVWVTWQLNLPNNLFVWGRRGWIISHILASLLSFTIRLYLVTR
jgi:hypothetical protein